MPKIKTNSGAKKRFQVTKKGKVKRAHGFKSHLLEGKSAGRKRKLRKSAFVSSAEIKRVRRMLPYAG